MQQRNAARQCQSMKNIVSSAHLSTTKRTCQSETHCMQRQGKRRRLCSSHSSPVLVAEKKFGFPSAPARCHRLQRRKQRRTLDRLDRDRLDRWGSVGCLDPWTFFHLPQTCSSSSSSSTCERDCSQCRCMLSRQIGSARGILHRSAGSRCSSGPGVFAVKQSRLPFVMLWRVKERFHCID